MSDVAITSDTVLKLALIIFESLFGFSLSKPQSAKTRTISEFESSP